MTAKSRVPAWVFALLVTLVAAIYLGIRARDGWIAHDEGLLAHTAERVLQGELPHRDFDDMYTGGLTYLHAFAFELFGVRLTSMRWILLIFAIATVPVWYAIGARVAGPLAATVTTWTCLAWSVPNYFAGLPTWYTLFFASFGALATLRFLDTRRAHWLGLAGVLGGLAFLAKITALYYMAGVFVTLLYVEVTSGNETAAESSAAGAWLFRLAVGSICAALCALVFVLIRRHAGPLELYVHWMPTVALCGVVVLAAQRAAPTSLAVRARRLSKQVAIFALGVALPVVPFVLAYASAGALDDLIRGLFVLPRVRLDDVYYPLPGPGVLALALVPAAVLAAGWFRRRRWDPILAIVAAIPLGVLLLTAAAPFGPEDDTPVYRMTWQSVRWLPPIVTLLGAHALAFRGELSVARRQQLFLLTAMLALMALLQYPYAFAVYFCYVAPFLWLTIHYLAALQPAPRRPIQGVAVVFCLLFALVWLNRSYVRGLGVTYIPRGPNAWMDLPRAGLRIWDTEGEHYRQLVETIQASTEPGSYIYAAPDCPEVYFLSDRRNPTRTMYDVFDVQEERVKQIARQLHARDVRLAVVNSMQEFSKGLDPELESFLARRYPVQTWVGPFVVLQSEGP